MVEGIQVAVFWSESLCSVVVRILLRPSSWWSKILQNTDSLLHHNPEDLNLKGESYNFHGDEDSSCGLLSCDNV
jgi:hypothetical protein